MSFSRRAFVKTLGVGGAGLLSTRFVGGDRLFSGLESVLHAQGGPILLHNNENPLGPGDAAIQAMRAVVGAEGHAVGRYPFAYSQGLIDAIAAKFQVKPENVMVGVGSSELLRSATQVFTSKDKPLIEASPTYEECAGYANLIGTPVTSIKLNSKLQLDLDAMAAASKGAGMVFLNNPNNPTATVHPASAIEACAKNIVAASPETIVLIDEAYHDYVTDPSHKTQIPLALSNPNVIVARTFSKAYGMAGLRVGFVIGMEETLKKMRSWQGGMGISSLALAAATASIKDQARIDAEAKRNTEARQYTLDWFKNAGYEATDSQCNFIFVDVKRPTKVFRDACRANGVLVGRDFPAYPMYCRISIGTMEEMQKATEVFGKALALAATAA